MKPNAQIRFDLKVFACVLLSDETGWDNFLADEKFGHGLGFESDWRDLFSDEFFII